MKNQSKALLNASFAFHCSFRKYAKIVVVFASCIYLVAAMRELL